MIRVIRMTKVMKVTRATWVTRLRGVRGVAGWNRDMTICNEVLPGVTGVSQGVNGL